MRAKAEKGQAENWPSSFKARRIESYYYCSIQNVALHLHELFDYALIYIYTRRSTDDVCCTIKTSFQLYYFLAWKHNLFKIKMEDTKRFVLHVLLPFSFRIFYYLCERK